MLPEETQIGPVTGSGARLSTIRIRMDDVISCWKHVFILVLDFRLVKE